MIVEQEFDKNGNRTRVTNLTKGDPAKGKIGSWQGVIEKKVLSSDGSGESSIVSVHVEVHSLSDLIASYSKEKD